MHITIKEIDTLSDIVVLIEEPPFFPDICQFYVMVEYDPEEAARFPSRWDELGHPGSKEEANIKESWIALGTDYDQHISISQVEEKLKKTGFFTEVCEKIREAV